MSASRPGRDRDAEILRQTARSPLALLLALLATLSTLLTLWNTGKVWRALDWTPAIVVACLCVLPAVLASVGLWRLYGAARGDRRDLRRELRLLKVSLTGQTVLLILVVWFLFIYTRPVYFMTEGWYGENPLPFLVTAWLGVGIVLWLIGAFRTLNALLEPAKTGGPRSRLVTALPIISFVIGALLFGLGFLLLPARWSWKAMEDLTRFYNLSGACFLQAAALVCFGCLLLYRRRRLVQAAAEDRAAAWSVPETPARSAGPMEVPFPVPPADPVPGPTEGAVLPKAVPSEPEAAAPAAPVLPDAPAPAVLHSGAVRPDPVNGPGAKALRQTIRSPLYVLLALLCTAAASFGFFVLWDMAEVSVFDLLYAVAVLLAPTAALLLIPIGLWIVYGSAEEGRAREGGFTVIKTGLMIRFLILVFFWGAILFVLFYFLLTSRVVSWVAYAKNPFAEVTVEELQILLAFFVLTFWYIGCFRTLRTVRFILSTGRNTETPSMACIVLSLVIGLWCLAEFVNLLSIITTQLSLFLLACGAAFLCFGALQLRLRARLRRAAD